MIDLKNKPEGAARFNRTCRHGWLKKDNEGVAYFVPTIGWKHFTSSDAGMGAWIASEIISVDEWTIHSNTLPLSELSDEQRGLLFNHWCNGGARESETSSGFIELPSKAVMWIESVVYRAKQKSERELFIEAAKELVMWDFSSEDFRLLNIMHEVGFKAPKDGE
jgi:hypothetical protein